MSHLAWAEIFYVWKIHEYFIASTISTKSQNTVSFETSSIYSVVHLFLEIFVGILLKKVDMLAPHLAYWPEITFYLLQRNWLIRDMCYIYTHIATVITFLPFTKHLCVLSDDLILCISGLHIVHTFTQLLPFTFYKADVCFLRWPNIVHINILYYPYHGYKLNTYWHSDYILPFTKNLSVL